VTADWSGHKAEVERLSGIASRAAARERSCRAGLSARGRQVARAGKLIGLVAVAGVALLTVARRRDDRDDEQSGDGERRPGPLEQAGDLILTLLRWGVAASQLWAMATTPSQSSPAAEAAREG
jgi:hypothetical protein